MSRHRARLIGWDYDDRRQQITTPAGQIITLTSIAQRLQDAQTCRYDFDGAWTGWRMRGARLMPPHAGSRCALRPDTAPLFERWIKSGLAWGG